VEQTQRELVELLDREQASLAVRSAAVALVIYTSLQHSADYAAPCRVRCSAGRMPLASSSRQPGGTNYPILLSVDDAPEGFVLTMETDPRIDARAMIGYVWHGLAVSGGGTRDEPS